MSNEGNGGGAETVRNKKEIWKDICKDCGILKIEMDCQFGCSIVEDRLKGFRGSRKSNRRS